MWTHLFREIDKSIPGETFAAELPHLFCLFLAEKLCQPLLLNTFYLDKKKIKPWIIRYMLLI